MRIIYWTTSCLEPRIEAISKEIFSLSEYFRDSFIFGVSQHYRLKISIKRRYVGFHPLFDLFLRLLIPIIEKSADISNVYGEISPWLFYKTLRQKPIVHTIASEKGILVRDYLVRCRSIITQTRGMKRRLQELGVEKQKIHLVYPGVDLKKFKPAGMLPRTEKPKILFATAPRSKEELEARGVYFLIDTARSHPNIFFHFLFRKWDGGYTSIGVTKALIGKYKLNNVTITDTIVENMSRIYQAFHFTIIPYTQSNGGKECPNSLIESLACGIPVLISDISPFAYFVRENGCGAVFSISKNGFAKTVEEGMQRYEVLRRRARSAAENYFDQTKVFKFYNELYKKIRQ